jgi:hypothetical protein
VTNEGSKIVFVRSKVVKGFEYYQVVENRRVGGKVVQRVVIHLGLSETVGEALDAERRNRRVIRRQAARLRLANDTPTTRKALARLSEREAASAARIERLKALFKLMPDDDDED